MPWKYLNFFLDDDEELADIGKRYSQGDENMMSGHVKKRLAEVRCLLAQPPTVLLLVGSPGAALSWCLVRNTASTSRLCCLLCGLVP